MKKTYQILNILGFIGVLVMNYLANALPLGGRNTGEISGLYPTLFTPTGLTFAIWGLIYLLLAVFIVLQSRGLFQKDKPTQSFVDAIGPWFFINCLANMAWLLAWHHLMIGLAMVIMLVILASLIIIYERLQIGRVEPGAGVKYGVFMPFSVYLGWITVATIANASILLTDIGWDGFGISPVIWTVIMLVIGTLLGMIMLFQRRDIAYALVLVWAFAGIYAAVKMNDEANLVAKTAVSLATLLVLGAIVQGGRKLLMGRRGSF
ncbi:MAG: tryptophan-rich sensory protein [Saprospiraceae bacterium]|nr:tryptophan-rich sensory protein [Saprospiraceae bacterium]